MRDIPFFFPYTFGIRTLTICGREKGRDVGERSISLSHVATFRRKECGAMVAIKIHLRVADSTEPTWIAWVYLQIGEVHDVIIDQATPRERTEQQVKPDTVLTGSSMKWEDCLDENRKWVSGRLGDFSSSLIRVKEVKREQYGYHIQTIYYVEKVS